MKSQVTVQLRIQKSSRTAVEDIKTIVLYTNSLGTHLGQQKARM